ncbi:hypothetical protein L226DRAFT_341338 [Lentinus tigrinus ALCF2SS1-7]|uniref:uncharacterized protein n=1 Tax=Lentinus tigrinus ALCF2SS1-7 TaxID=1328758 RepID=UPI0011661700|nr:hypothetical protein L226DRAFT_341338 [Lentinus tigrinus ALCF2SS1-7]
MLSASCCFLVVLRSRTFSPVLYRADDRIMHNPGPFVNRTLEENDMAYLRLQSPPRRREAGPTVASRSLRKSVVRVRVSSPRSRRSPAPHGIPSFPSHEKTKLETNSAPRKVLKTWNAQVRLVSELPIVQMQPSVHSNPHALSARDAGQGFRAEHHHLRPENWTRGTSPP